MSTTAETRCRPCLKYGYTNLATCQYLEFEIKLFNPLVPGVLSKGRYKEHDLKTRHSIFIKMKNALFQSLEVTSNRTDHVLGLP